jgi:hypothetical protein
MDKGRKFQPRMAGGLLLATVAIATSVGWTKDIAPNDSPAPSQTTEHLLRNAEMTTAPAAAPAPTPAPAPASALAVAQIHRVTPPIEQHRQVWECTINGQRAFSDYPCGDKSTLREIGPINRMDPTPILPYSRSFVPESSGQSRDSYPSQQADSYASEQQSADNSYPADDSYPVFVGNPVGMRRRPHHEERRRSHRKHQPQSHDRVGLQPGRK